MMTIFNTSEYEHFMVVRPEDLTSYRGWTVLGMVQGEEGHTEYLNGSSMYVKHAVARILIGSKKDSAEMRLAAEVSKLQDENRVCRSEVIKIKNEAKAEQDKASLLCSELNNTIEKHWKTIDSLRNNQKPLEDKCVKMEGDLSKIRKAIGELQFNEIISDKKLAI